MLPKALTAAILRPIVLSTLDCGEAYGYQLSQRIEFISNGSIDWNTGTLYPVLHRMEAEGLVESFWRESDSGPKRKYYRITKKGKKAVAEEQVQWDEIHGIMHRLWQKNVSFG